MGFGTGVGMSWIQLRGRSYPAGQLCFSRLAKAETMASNTHAKDPSVTGCPDTRPAGGALAPFWPGLAGALAGAVLCLAATPAATEDAYLTFDESINVEALKWGVGVLALLLVGWIGWRLLKATAARRHHRDVPVDPEAQSEAAFRTHAVKLGLTGLELENLTRIALRLAPQSPADLLAVEPGREYLIADLRHRAARREREIAVLESIRDRLMHLGDHDLRERQTSRVDTGLAVWVEPRHPPDTDDRATTSTDQNEDETETVFENLQSVQGYLEDLGEGGAAVAVPLAAKSGDVVEIWSADWKLFLPRTAGTVVAVEPAEGDDPPVLHLRFLYPELQELRPALADIGSAETVGTRRRATPSPVDPASA